MVEFLEITGGVALSGNVKISGAKNAALPVCIASLLAAETCEFANVPNLEDIDLITSLLEQCGSEIEYVNSTLRISTPVLKASEARYSLVKALRASFWVLAPLLARGRAARVALPGGDIIGARPVDIHLEALTRMGADIQVKHGVVYATALSGLKPAKIEFRFPSVGATHQIMMAAALTVGTTVIHGAAREPEVVALAQMLNSMGAEVEGAGSSKVVIHGRSELGGAKVNLIGDRIEAGTYLIAGIITRGRVMVEGIEPAHLQGFLEVLESMGLEPQIGPNSIEIDARRELLPVSIATGPFPELASDLQAPLMAVLSTIPGESRLEEHVFEGRFGHVSELCRMGAHISLEDRTAVINGVTKLSAALVEGHDIRAAASLVVAALAADGTSQVYDSHHIRRGYERLEGKLIKIGARICRKSLDAEDYLFAGC